MALNLTARKEFIMISFNDGTGMKVGLPELKRFSGDKYCTKFSLKLGLKKERLRNKGWSLNCRSRLGRDLHIFES